MCSSLIARLAWPQARHTRGPAGGWLLALALSLTAIAAGTGCASHAQMARLALQVRGNELVDGAGKPIRLLGVDRSGAEYACIQGWQVVAGPTGEGSIAAMTSWHINAVRLPLNEDCWLGINGVSARFGGEHYRAVIRGYVARLNKAGLYVILDLHWSAPGRTRATGQQPMADLDHAPAFWSSVARAFRNDPAVLFDLYNEPNGISWQCWRDGCAMPGGWRLVLALETTFPHGASTSPLIR